MTSAGAQFLLSLVLLKLLPARDFGSFSFLLVTSQLMLGIWSALFCAPLLIAMTHRDIPDRSEVKAAILAIGLLMALVTALPIGALGWAMKLPIQAALVFGLYTSFSLIRWVGRTDAFARGRAVRAMASDIVYAAVLLMGLGAIILAGKVSLAACFTILLIAIVAGLLPLGSAFLSVQFLQWKWPDWQRYRQTWRQHASWSLLGVVTTEVTANSQVYLVTALFGPAAFAPVAATALLIRPCSVAVNALSEYERAQMARSIGNDDISGARHAVSGFRNMLGVVWIATALATAALLIFAPRLLFPVHYPLQDLGIGASLWLAVAAVRFARAPESSLLQAGGAFRPLAFASVYSCAFSMLGVLVLLLLFGPLWSILGTLVGELVFAAWTWREARRWGERKLRPVARTAREA